MDQLQTSHRLLPDQRRALERELADCDARLRHLVDAVGTGKATEAVFADLQKYEARKKAVTEQLDRADRLSQLSSVDAKRIERQLTERASDITQLLGQHIPHTRQILRKLIPDEVLEGKRLPGRLICTPIEDARGRGYTFFARGSYSRLLGTGVAVNDGGGGHGS